MRNFPYQYCYNIIPCQYDYKNDNIVTILLCWFKIDNIVTILFPIKK